MPLANKVLTAKPGSARHLRMRGAHGEFGELSLSRYRKPKCNRSQQQQSLRVWVVSILIFRSSRENVRKTPFCFPKTAFEQRFC